MHTASLRLDVSSATGADYRQVVAEYDRLLDDADQDRDRCREEMRAFGAYLRRRGVAPEHIVTCVHQALGHVTLAGDFSSPKPIAREIVRWAIAGYYGTEE
jgi:hypothetical protein